MSEFTKNAWAAFFVFLGLGVWAIPAIIAAVALYYFIGIRRPWIINRN